MNTFRLSPLPTGKTLVATLFIRDSTTPIVLTYTGTEVVNRPGVYIFDVGSLANGDYDITLSGLGTAYGSYVMRVSASGITVADYWFQIEGGGLTAQEVRDAMKLAPSAGAAASGSIDDQLDDTLDAIDSIETSVTTLPASVTVNRRQRGKELELFVGETGSVSMTLWNVDGSAMSLSGKTLRVVFEQPSGTDLATVENGSITVSSNTITFTIPSAVTSEERIGDDTPQYAVRHVNGGDMVLVYGPAPVRHAGKVD